MRAWCVNECRAADVCASLLHTLLRVLLTRSPRSLTTLACLNHSRTFARESAHNRVGQASASST